MKKILIIIAIIVIIGIAVAIFFMLQKSPSGSSGGGTTGTLPPIATSTPFNPPSGTTLTIGTSEGSVTVNNFYNGAPWISADHTAVLATTTDAYDITYDTKDSSFNIDIKETPFETIRPEAEAAFLRILGVSQSDACKLIVQVGTTFAVDPNYAGQNLGLSFCPSNGAFQAK
jgi:hypothetical protein